MKVDIVRIKEHISDETGRFTLIEDNDTTVLTRYQHSDHLGSSCLETDGAGVVISYEEYHPFGSTAYSATLSSLGASAKRHRYCGKERDEESGLYYYGARYYAGWLGRFVSVDPRESKYFFQSSYAYAENSPVTKMDFNGEGTNLPEEEDAKNMPKVEDKEAKESEANEIKSNSTISPKIFVISLDKKVNSEFVAAKANEFLGLKGLNQVVQAVNPNDIEKIKKGNPSGSFVVIGKSTSQVEDFINSNNISPDSKSMLEKWRATALTTNFEKSSSNWYDNQIMAGKINKQEPWKKGAEVVAISTERIDSVLKDNLKGLTGKIDLLAHTVIHGVGHNLAIFDFDDVNIKGGFKIMSGLGNLISFLQFNPNGIQKIYEKTNKDFGTDFIERFKAKF